MNPENRRYHGLDFFRCFAMLMGLVIHAPLVFYLPEIVGENNIGSHSLTVDFIISWIHAWRMPAFFILSGFFAQMMFQKRDIRYFLSDRFVRIFVTLLIFASFFNWIWESEIGELFHFWFLYYLFMISVWSAVLQAFSRKINLKQFEKYFSNFILKIAAAMIYFVILVFLTSFARENGREAVIPEHVRDFAFIPLLYYWIWYLLGQILYLNRNFLDRLGSNFYLVSLGFTAASLQYFLWSLQDDLLTASQLFINISSTGSTFCWAFLLIGLSHRIITQSSRILNLFLELSYPIYLIHLLPAVTFGTIMFHLKFNALEMLAANIFLTFIASIILYYIFIKYTPVSWIVNGYKKSWFKPFK